MSEELIARIERPRAETGPVVGHDEAATMLAEAWTSGRMAHAWILAGPPGIGKATLAWRFVRFVAAGGEAVPGQGPLDTDPAHPRVRMVIAGSHPDTRLVRRTYNPRPPNRFRTEIAVDDVRAAAQFLAHTAAMGEWRCIVVDAAEEMNANAQNALLKVLEEPPPRTLIVLVTHAPSRLLPTIRSRCRMATLRALDTAGTARVLACHCPDLGDADARDVARLAEGSAGRAIDLATGGGLDLYRDLVGLLGTLPALDKERLHETAERLGAQNAESSYRTYMGLLNWIVARYVRALATGGEGEGPLTLALARRGVEPWLKAWENIGELRERADSVNLDRKQVVLNTFFELSAAARP